MTEKYKISAQHCTAAYILNTKRDLRERLVENVHSKIITSRRLLIGIPAECLAHVLRIPDVLGSNSGPETDNLDEAFCGLAQSLQANDMTMPQIRSRPLPTISFPINYYYSSKLLAESLNEPHIRQT